MKLVVDVDHAKDLLLTNKQKHVAEYELQLEAWKKSYEEYTKALQAWSQMQGADGFSTPRPQEPEKPYYYGDSYDKLYNKLNVHVSTTIELSENRDEYEQIFENRFGWSTSFSTLSAGYIQTGHIDAAKINAIKLA